MLAVAGVRIVHLGVLVFLRPQERNACSQDLFKCLTGWLLPRAALLWALLPMYSDAVRRDAVRHASHVTGDNCSPPSISIHFSQGAHSQNLEMLERVLVPQQFLQCTAWFRDVVKASARRQCQLSWQAATVLIEHTSPEVTSSGQMKTDCTYLDN